MRWEVLSLPPGLLPAHTRCPALVPCSAAGCAILHAPPPCLSTGGRIGCDWRSRLPLPTVCLLVRDPPPPPTLPSEHAGVRICTLPHRSRRDTGARALISQFLPCLRPVPLLADFMSVCHRLCSSPVHVPSLSRVHSTLSSPPSKAPVCHRSRNATRVVALSTVVGSAVFLMRSEPFSPTPRRPPGRATLKPRPMARGTPGILRGVSACCVSWARHDLVVFVRGFCTALKSAI